MKKFFLLAALMFAVTSRAIDFQSGIHLSAGSGIETGDLLSGIQDSIFNAFTVGVMTHDDAALAGIRSRLEILNKSRRNNLVIYWLAYTDYYRTVLYMQTGNVSDAAKAATAGADALKSIRNKTSEEYALLSLLQGLQLQFSGMDAASLAMEMSRNAALALELDQENIRANYACGITDFFTPEAYGGGKAAEKYFLKAISLPAQKVPGKYHPSWGKEESYEYLVRLYVRKGLMDKALEYCDEGLELFPSSAMLNSLKGQLR